jgi:hypothetical protein
MTLAVERTRAVMQTKQFLIDLLNTSKTPRVPKHIRQQAYSLLKHYPTIHDFEMVEAAWGDDGILFECPFSTKDEFLKVDLCKQSN